MSALGWLAVIVVAAVLILLAIGALASSIAASTASAAASAAVAGANANVSAALCLAGVLAPFALIGAAAIGFGFVWLRSRRHRVCVLPAPAIARPALPDQQSTAVMLPQAEPDDDDLALMVDLLRSRR